MDQCTKIIKRNQWVGIINACQARPSGTSVQQWLKDNGISYKSYYYWLSKFRHETFANQTTAIREIGNKTGSFAEISISETECHDFVFSPDVIIKSGTCTVGLSNSASPTLVALVMEGLRDAH